MQAKVRVSANHWKNPSNHVQFFDNLGKKLGIKTLDDWYQIKVKDVHQHGGSGLLTEFYDDSLLKALKRLYPQHDWIPWLFHQVPKGFWTDLNNQKKYVEWLSSKLNIKRLEDWYNVKGADFENNAGSGLLTSVYKGSIFKLLTTIYPEFSWNAWKFSKVPQTYWMNPSNQVEFMKWLGAQLGYQNTEDWYSLNASQIIRYGGKGLLRLFNGSVYSLLCSVFPQTSWDGWRFDKVPRSFWNDPSQAAKFLAYLSERLHITHLEDWYRVSRNQLWEFGAGTLVKKYGTIEGLLRTYYPQYSWDSQKFRNPSKKSAQRWMRVVVEELFPKEEDYFHPHIVFKSQNRMQFDVFVPSKKLAFEYQGKHHYEHFFLNSKDHHKITQKNRDEEKKEACKQHGITLIEVPYWWSKKKSSLVATLHEARPDLVEKGNGVPIPKEPPHTKRKGTTHSAVT